MSVDPSKYSTIVNVRNIGEDMTNEELKDMFSKYGTVTSCKIMLSGNAECGRFAYIAFEDPDAAEEAIIELNCQELTPGRRIYLRRTGEKIILQPEVKKSPESPKVERVNRCEIFVKNLDPIIDAAYLRSKFRDCGPITSAKIIIEGGRSKGYGFVSFETHEAANKAVADMNGQIFVGQRIHVALATGTDRNKNLRGFGFARLDEYRDFRGNPTASTSHRTGHREPLTPRFCRALENILRSCDDADRS